VEAAGAEAEVDDVALPSPPLLPAAATSSGARLSLWCTATRRSPCASAHVSTSQREAEVEVEVEVVADVVVVAASPCIACAPNRCSRSCCSGWWGTPAPQQPDRRGGPRCRGISASTSTSTSAYACACACACVWVLLSSIMLPGCRALAGTVALLSSERGAWCRA
jgi:hypothetical protein